MPSDSVQLPLVELFGPTIQGEGPAAGKPAHFVRLGGCDYRCDWCDSPHAVDPAEVRAVERVDAAEIARRVKALGWGARRVVLTGGNPALHELGPLVRMLQGVGYLVHAETQGSVWRDWLERLDLMVVSPKPPSARWPRARQHRAFMRRAERMLERGRAAVKIVVFDEGDLEWAARYRGEFPYPLFLSAGTPQGHPSWETRTIVADRYAWLAEAVAGRDDLGDATVLPQLHVIAWGTRRGV